jgi:cytochrome c oxidase subunit IV
LSEQPHSVEHAHPSAIVYIKVAVILGLITGLEVAVYYMEALSAYLAPILIALSATKFGIVAGYYMHLKFDNRLFTAFFVGGLALAASLVLALMTLFGVWGRPVPH